MPWSRWYTAVDSAGSGRIGELESRDKRVGCLGEKAWGSARGMAPSCRSYTEPYMAIESDRML